jgi:hypothetical protein
LSITIGVIFAVSAAVYGISGIVLDRNCTGYLKRAADANTIDLAKSQLDIAVKHMEGAGYTKGYTSVIYQTPDEDVGFWYGNIKKARAELNNTTGLADDIHKNNITLMKLRETLLDAGESGKQEITFPEGLAVYPHNRAMAIWFWLSGILFAVAALMCFVLWDD